MSALARTIVLICAHYMSSRRAVKWFLQDREGVRLMKGIAGRADFLAGAHLESGNSDSLLFALGRLYSLLPDPQKTEFVQQMGKVQ